MRGQNYRGSRKCKNARKGRRESPPPHFRKCVALNGTLKKILIPVQSLYPTIVMKMKFEHQNRVRRRVLPKEGEKYRPMVIEEKVVYVFLLGCRPSCAKKLIKLFLSFCETAEISIQETSNDKEKSESGFLLDSCDTFLLSEHSHFEMIDINVKEKTQENHASLIYEKKIDAMDVLRNAEVGHTEFICELNAMNNGFVDVAVEISQRSRKIQFVTRQQISEIEVSEQPEFRHLTEAVPRLFNLNTDGKTLPCLAVPFVRGMINENDDIIIALWICPFADENKLLKTLLEEQLHLGNVQVDTENSFMLCGMDKNVRVNCSCDSDWMVQPSYQTISPKRISEGGRAKAVFECNSMDKKKMKSSLTISISVKQLGENNEIKFIARQKLNRFVYKIDEQKDKNQDKKKKFVSSKRTTSGRPTSDDAIIGGIQSMKLDES